MFQERHIEELINLVEGNIKFLQLFEGLDALNLFDFTSGQMKNPDVPKWGADISEAADNRVV